jgi:hypothetical protein
MHIRDREIQRLISYATGLGLEVIYDDTENSSTAASWALDGTEIIIFRNTKPKQNKTDIILSLIHELGHHLHYIWEKNRKPDFKFDEAITREMLLENNEIQSPTPKHLRKKILDIEKAGALYWDTVYRDVGLQIPYWKLQTYKEFDVWQYDIYYRTGHFPSSATRTQKLKALTKKYKI